MKRRSGRRLPTTAQVLFSAMVALTITLALMGFRAYPWSLATMMGLAFGALAYTGWGTLVRLRGIYDRGSDRGSEPQGKKARERSSKR